MLTDITEKIELIDRWYTEISDLLSDKFGKFYHAEIKVRENFEHRRTKKVSTLESADRSFFSTLRNIYKVVSHTAFYETTETSLDIQILLTPTKRQIKIPEKFQIDVKNGADNVILPQEPKFIEYELKQWACCINLWQEELHWLKPIEQLIEKYK